VQQDIDTVESGGTVVGAVFGEVGTIGGQHRHGPTYEKGSTHEERHIDTGGGDNIDVGDISGSTGIAIGRNASASVTQTQGISGAELAALFAPLEQAVQSGPADNQPEAQEKLQDLEAEVAKGDEADDSRMAGLINDLVDLVPGAVGATVSVFASPIFGGIAGPVTDFVLKRLGAK
jgi:hypothetical protein